MGADGKLHRRPSAGLDSGHCAVLSHSSVLEEGSGAGSAEAKGNTVHLSCVCSVALTVGGIGFCRLAILRFNLVPVCCGGVGLDDL